MDDASAFMRETRAVESPEEWHFFASDSTAALNEFRDEFVRQ